MQEESAEKGLRKRKDGTRREPERDEKTGDGAGHTPDPVWALVDRTLIRTVPQNLLQNAWKFTAGPDDGDSHPSIEFATTRDADGRIRCYVRVMD